MAVFTKIQVFNTGINFSTINNFNINIFKTMSTRGILTIAAATVSIIASILYIIEFYERRNKNKSVTTGEGSNPPSSTEA